MKKINLILTSSIAVEKAIELYNLLKNEYEVNLIASKNCKYFIDLDQYGIKTDIFTQEKYPIHYTGKHIEFTKDNKALNVVYPATYNFIGKISSGIADDLASLTISASESKTMLFPSMNSRMYLNPIFQKNISYLSSLSNFIIIEPTIGKLASRDTGIGRALEPIQVKNIIDNQFLEFKSLENKKILLNFGRSRSYIDNVRYITNGSSGKMGMSIFNLIKTFTDNYKIIHGDTDVFVPVGNNFKKIETNEQMLKEMLSEFEDSDLVICSAALVDFESINTKNVKIHKNEIDKNNLKIELKEAIDVLEELGKQKSNQFLVGFSLDNEFDEENAWNKIKNKNLDLLVLNLTSAMSSDFNEIKIFVKKDKKIISVNHDKKQNIAYKILSIINQEIKN